MAPKSKRRVVIGEKDRGVRHGRFPQGERFDETLGPVKANHPNKSGRIIVPTHDRRHMTKIRLGVLDTSTAFSRKRREALTVDPDVELERGLASTEAVEEKLEQLSGREKGADDAKGKKQKAAKKVLRARKTRKDDNDRSAKKGKTRKGVQKDAKPRAKAKVNTKAKAKPKKKTVTKPKAKAKVPVKRKPVKRKVTK